MTGCLADRADAGRRLAPLLRRFRGDDVVVLGLPRGGVLVAAEVARELAAPLDVIVVRKLGVPVRPELAMGAIGEDGARVVDGDVVRRMRVTPQELADVERREAAVLRARTARLRAVRAREPLSGRTALVVDDGLATGSTARAACLVARAHRALRVVLAVPVAPWGWRDRLAGVADDLVCVVEPREFRSIGEFYADFSPTDEESVLAALASAAAGGP